MTDIPDLPPVLERLLPTGYHAQIGAYALDSLPAEERIAFEAHLRECGACQDELPILLDAARVLRQAIVPGSAPRPSEEPASTTYEPTTWVSAKRAQIGEETTQAPVVETVEEAEELVAPESLVEDIPPSDESVEADAATPEESVEGDSEEQPGADNDAATLEDVPTTLEPLRSSILLDLPDADVDDADLIAAAAARAPEAPAAPTSRREIGRASCRERVLLGV